MSALSAEIFLGIIKKNTTNFTHNNFYLLISYVEDICQLSTEHALKFLQCCPQ